MVLKSHVALISHVAQPLHRANDNLSTSLNIVTQLEVGVRPHALNGEE